MKHLEPPIIIAWMIFIPVLYLWVIAFEDLAPKLTHGVFLFFVFVGIAIMLKNLISYLFEDDD